MMTIEIHPVLLSFLDTTSWLMLHPEYQCRPYWNRTFL